MYFEARIHTLREVNSAEEAAAIIKGSDHNWYDVLKWSNGQYNFLCVADGRLENMLFELAILREEPDGKLYQVDTITNGLIDSKEKLAKYFLKAESAVPVWEVQLMIGNPKEDEVAWFLCGCCGNRFKANIKKQLEDDQDAGYGLCDECAKLSNSKIQCLW